MAHFNSFSHAAFHITGHTGTQAYRHTGTQAYRHVTEQNCRLIIFDRKIVRENIWTLKKENIAA